MFLKNTIRKNQTSRGKHRMVDSNFTIMRHTIQNGQPSHCDIHVETVIAPDLICIIPEVISNKRYFLTRHDEVLFGLFDAAKVWRFYAIHLRTFYSSCFFTIFCIRFNILARNSSSHIILAVSAYLNSIPSSSLLGIMSIDASAYPFFLISSSLEKEM